MPIFLACITSPYLHHWLAPVKWSNVGFWRFITHCRPHTIVCLVLVSFQTIETTRRTLFWVYDILSPNCKRIELYDNLEGCDSVFQQSMQTLGSYPWLFSRSLHRCETLSFGDRLEEIATFLQNEKPILLLFALQERLLMAVKLRPRVHMYWKSVADTSLLNVQLC